MQLHLKATKSFNQLVFFLKRLAFFSQGAYLLSLKKTTKNPERMPKTMNTLPLSVHQKNQEKAIISRLNWRSGRQTLPSLPLEEGSRKELEKHLVTAQ